MIKAVTHHHEFDDERGGEEGRRAFTPWRPLEPGLQRLLDHIEAEGLTVLADEQLSELQVTFGVAEHPRDAGAGTLRINLVGYDAEVRRLLLERGWMLYGCGHWHKDSASSVLGALDAQATTGELCRVPPQQIDGERAGGRNEAAARLRDRRHEHPH